MLKLWLRDGLIAREQVSEIWRLLKDFGDSVREAIMSVITPARRVLVCQQSLRRANWPYTPQA